MATSSSREDDPGAEASSEVKVLLSGFGAILAPPEGDAPGLSWFAAPDSWPLTEGREEGRGGSWALVGGGDGKQELVLRPPSKKDFWRKTFYDPVLVKDDGPFLYAELTGSSRYYTVEASFVLRARSQFDQAGLMIRVDHEHWIKAGIEVVDLVPRLSCVVTNSYSDWSTQPWSKYETLSFAKEQETGTGERETILEVVVPARIRVHCRNDSFVVEAWMDEDQKWEFIRVCHLSRHLATSAEADPLETHPSVRSAWQGPSPDPSSNRFWAGLFAACPQQSGASAAFQHFSIASGSRFDHNAEGNQE